MYFCTYKAIWRHLIWNLCTYYHRTTQKVISLYVHFDYLGFWFIEIITWIEQNNSLIVERLYISMPIVRILLKAYSTKIKFTEERTPQDSMTLPRMPLSRTPLPRTPLPRTPLPRTTLLRMVHYPESIVFWNWWLWSI